MSDKSMNIEAENAEQTLEHLWLKQQTQAINISEIKIRWSKIQTKQRLYFAIDIAGVVFMLWAFYFAFDKMGLFAKSWMAILTVFASVTAGYFSYLRRFALSWSNSAIESYIEHLKNQLKSNIRIARLNRDLSLWMIAAIMFFHAGIFYFDDVVFETALRKGAISLAILALFTPPFWWWANNRAKRFKRELTILEGMLKS